MSYIYHLYNFTLFVVRVKYECYPPNQICRITRPCTHFDDDAAFIIAQCHIVGAPETAYTPHSLHAIVQCAFQAVSA